MKTRDRLFVINHSADDVRRLALQADRYPDVDLPWALQQIAGRQAAHYKIPTWAENPTVEYPVHLSLEQCSSETTARYKASVVKRHLEKPNAMVDLTGGFGVDCAFLSELFSQVTYVERNADLCELAAHNFKTLGLTHIQVVNADAEEYLKKLQKTDLIYIDPARRNATGGRTYAIGDCTPDILAMKSAFFEHTHLFMVKLSPMLDWHLAVQQMNSGSPCVAEVHIVSVKNECKELLFVLRKDFAESLRIYCTNDEQTDVFTPSETFPEVVQAQPKIGIYLYEPNASIMKSGCFAEMAHRYDLTTAGKHSHLFFADHPIENFPGRIFRITAVSTLNKKELAQALQGTTQANITVRNFPLTAEQLRKKLKMKDGGDCYIFATTLADNQRKLILCERWSKKK